MPPPPTDIIMLMAVNVQTSAVNSDVTAEGREILVVGFV